MLETACFVSKVEFGVYFLYPAMKEIPIARLQSVDSQGTHN